MPKCTKCSRPRRGHVGPYDDLCTLLEAGPGFGLGVHDELSADDESDKLSEAGGGGPDPIKKITPRKKSDAAFAMKELMIQMGNLACSVQKMAEENKGIADAQKQ
jgi:hypothetical protein